MRSQIGVRHSDHKRKVSWMTHVALDLGLKTTGIAWPGGSDHYTSPPALHRSPMTPAREHARYTWWRDTFRTVLADWPGAAVVVEAPIIHGTHARGAIPLIVLHGVLRAVAIDGGHTVDSSVKPSQLKRWATGKGNATKDEMVAAARRFERFEGTDHNEADAWLLWHYWSYITEVAA